MKQDAEANAESDKVARSRAEKNWTQMEWSSKLKLNWKT
jgi:hypothetical protein